MRTITTNLYTFDELSEEAKQKAIKKFYDINVDYDWWKYTYDDAEMIGCKISGFDLDRRSIGFDNEKDIETVAQLILENHGIGCDTNRLADTYLHDRKKLVEKFSDGVKTDIVTEENEYDFDQECDDLDREFIKQLGECYLIMLRDDYEWRTSEEQIIETIKCNEYEFTQDGKTA
jgi:hypothetical protein